MVLTVLWILHRTIQIEAALTSFLELFVCMHAQMHVHIPGSHGLLLVTLFRAWTFREMALFSGPGIPWRYSFQGLAFLSFCDLGSLILSEISKALTFFDSM